MAVMKLHGDPGMYRYHGCRCDECRAAATAQTQARRRLNRVETGPTIGEAAAMTPLQGEIWRAAVGYPDYEVSNLGRVRSLKFTYPRLLAATANRSGYLRVCLWEGNRSRHKFVHGLVCEAFLGPYPDGQEVRHLNDVKSDNRLTNLTYGTRSENIRDSVRNGTQPQVKKTHCPSGHPYDVANTYVSPEGWRRCRACARQRESRRRDRRAS